MQWSRWLEKWEMSSLKVQTPFLEMEWCPTDPDQTAAWELYVELLTRVTTQALPHGAGDELAALESIQSLFPTTRAVIKSNGRGCQEFTKIAIVILNQRVRPFTSKWHRLTALDDRLAEEPTRIEFRRELKELQKVLETYAGMLAEMAGVENLVTLEE